MTIIISTLPQLVEAFKLAELAPADALAMPGVAAWSGSGDTVIAEENEICRVPMGAAIRADRLVAVPVNLPEGMDARDMTAEDLAGCFGRPRTWHVRDVERIGRKKRRDVSIYRSGKIRLPADWPAGRVRVSVERNVVRVVAAADGIRPYRTASSRSKYLHAGSAFRKGGLVASEIAGNYLPNKVDGGIEIAVRP